MSARLCSTCGSTLVRDPFAGEAYDDMICPTCEADEPIVKISQRDWREMDATLRWCAESLQLGKVDAVTALRERLAYLAGLGGCTLPFPPMAKEGKP